MASIQEIRQQYPQYEDMSDEQLAKALHKKFYSDIEYSDFAQRIGLSAQPGEEARRGLVEEIGRQLGLTGRYIVEGVTSIPAMVAQPVADVADKGLEAAGVDFRFGNQAAGVSNLLTSAGVPVPETATERVVGDASRALAAGGAVTGTAQRIASPVAQTLAANPGLQAVSDISGGGAQGAVREAGGGPTAQLAAGITAGVVAPASLQTASAVRAGRTAAREPTELARLSSEHDVPLTVGEINQSPTLQKAETFLERAPGVGIRGFRERQAAATKTAAERFRDRFDSGEADVGEALQQSLRRVRDKNKAEASRRFDVVERLAKNTTEQVIPENTRRVAQEIVAREGALPAFQDEQLVKVIGDISSLPQMSFSVARKLRSRLLTSIRKAEKQALTGNASDEQVAALNRLRSAFEDDIGDFAARAGGGIDNAYRVANKYFRERVVPFKERNIRKAASDDFDTDQILATFIKRDSALRGRGKQAEKLMSNLDLKGKQAVKFAILSEAHETALTGDTTFSPAKFSQELKRLGDANEVIFTPREKVELDGLVKLMDAAKRSGQFMENPPTGIRAADLMGGAGVAALGAARPDLLVTGAAGTKAASLLLTTDKGRALLARMSRVKAGSSEWEEIIRAANREIEQLQEISARAAAVQGSQDRTATTG